MPLCRLAQRRPAQLDRRGHHRQGREVAALTTFEPLAGPSSLVAARPGPDLAAHGWTETEYVVRGRAVSYRGDLPSDGRWLLEVDGETSFATRCVVRRPASADSFSGTLVVEWLNVSSGTDAAPDWTYLSDEIVRRGHVWAGVSAQYVGVEGGSAAVGDLGLEPLKTDPRYAGLVHPGDAFCYGIFTTVAGALKGSGPLGDLDVETVLAVGESQSAYALTTYANGVQPLTGLFDGFLIHSRGGATMPLGEPGCAVDIAQFRTDPPMTIRDDLDVPVIMVQTETDLTGRLQYLPARQPDSERVRLWEVAGTAHADKFQIGDFEDFLGCPRPVNTGQQAYVVRAALRHLDRWARGGLPAPRAARLTVQDGAFAVDDVGNARGGVRTPAVDAPTGVLRGDTEPDAPVICQLFGSTVPLGGDVLRWLYASAEDYLGAYEQAVDEAIAAGFVLSEDRDAVLAEARPDLVDTAHGPSGSYANS
ncbi:alpha/beta hydrolase domain-containing protein [Nocardioides dilutus]